MNNIVVCSFDVDNYNKEAQCGDGSKEVVPKDIYNSHISTVDSSGPDIQMEQH